MRHVRAHLIEQRASRFDARPAPRARPKRKPKIPRNSARRARSPQPPRAVELFFVQALKRVAASFCRAMKAVVMHRIEEFAKQEDAARTDAKEKGPNDAKAKAVGKSLKSAGRGAVKVKDVTNASETAGERAESHSKNEFKRLGIDVRKEPEMKWLMDGWRKDNVARITDLVDEQAERIETILAEGYGRRAESIAEDLEEILGEGSERRAELIARDQVLTLNAQITRERQTAADIEKYVWTTSGDERVRDEHEALDGEVFSWDEGDPEEGHPGEAINCRCVAFPVLPELEGVGEEEEDD